MKHKVFWLLPLMVVLLMVGVMALDANWNCPVTGTSASTTVKDYKTYEDDPPYIDCQKAGNNFTIEFNITGIEIAAGSPENFNATLYIYAGNKQKLMLPLPIGNRSALNIGSLVRWTDFGELYTSGIIGKPKWYNNLTEGGYKWYVEVWNLTDTSTGNQILSSEKGLSSGSPVHFTIDHRGSSAMKAAAAYQAGADVGPEAASVFSGIGLPTIVGKIPAPILIALIIGAVWYFFFRKE